MKMNENIHKNIYSENNKTNLENPISLEIKVFRERINLLLERSNITLSFKEKKEIIELLNTDKNISLYKKNDEIIKKLLDKNELNFNYEEVKEKLIELKKLLPNSDLVFSSIENIFEKKAEKKVNFDEVIERFLGKKIIENILNLNFAFLEKYKEPLHENKEKYLSNIIKFFNKDIKEILENIITQPKKIKKEKFEKKMEKYFPIHKDIFFKKLINSIDQKVDDKIINDKKKLRKIIKNEIFNIIWNYLYVLFIFWEKIKLSDLDKYLDIEISQLSLQFAWAKNDMILLESFEKDLTREIEKKYWEKNQNSETDEIIHKPFFASWYRYLNRELSLEENQNQDKNIENTNEEKWIKISDKIEKHYKKATSQLLYIFETWIEWNISDEEYYKNDKSFRNIEIMIIKLLRWVEFLKKEHISFTDYPYRSINEEFIEKYFETFIEDSEKYQMENSIVILTNLAKNIFEKNEAKRKDWYKTLKDLICKTKETIAKVRMPDQMDENIKFDIKTVSFDTWTKVPENKKYELVFSEVIAKDWVIKFADFLNLKNENFWDLFEIFFRYFQNKINKNEEHDELLNKFNYIIREEWKEVREFIEQDVNNLNLLIVWWRFILKTRQLKAKWEEINSKNISEIHENPYWVIEKITEKLFYDNILWDHNKETLTFNPIWRVKNTSVKTINTMLRELIKWLRKWFIDLKNEKINLLDWRTKEIRAIKELYISPSLEISGSPSEIEKYIDSWIDLCFNILKWDFDKIDSEQENYFKNALVKNDILPKNLQNLEQENLENIQHLVEILKFIKKRIESVEYMLKIAKEDKEILEKDEEIKKKLESSNEGSSIGPDKRFSRAFIKLISDYGWNFNKIGDLTRMRVVSKSIDESINSVIRFTETLTNNKDITNISIIDKIWEPLSLAWTWTGYRDIKLLLKMKSWNTTEVQFQCEEMHQVKDKWLYLEANENKYIFEKMRKENSLFTAEEMNNLLELAQISWITLPTENILRNLIEDWEDYKVKWETLKVVTTKRIITTDDTYHISRRLDKKNPLYNKFIKLERIMTNSAWWKIVIKHLEPKNIQLDKKKKV